MKKILSGMLASSLILSMGTVSHASTMEDRLDNIFGMIDLVNGSQDADFTFDNGVITAYVGQGGQVVIPTEIEGIPVTAIGDGAFVGCDTLTSVVFPDGLQRIGTSAFESCTALTGVVIPDSVVELGLYAFSDCSALAEVTLSQGITTVGKATFQDCVSLEAVVIPSGVTVIGDYAFYQCTSLVTVELPVSVTEIGDYGFGDCSALVGISYEGSYKDKETISIGADSWALKQGLAALYEQGSSETPEATPDVTPEETPETPETTPQPEQSYEAETDPRPKVAEPSTAKVMVNGEVVPFAAYTIEGFNYFRLTDVSYALSGTSRQFEVTWDASIGAINMVTERPHLVLGTELLGNSGQEETALRFFAPVYKNGEEMVVTVYTIDGASYFKLDSLMVALDLNVGWDGETGTITITA